VSLSKLLIPLIIGALFMAFAATLPIVLWSEAGYTIRSEDQIDFLILVAGFGIALVTASGHVLRALRQVTQALHDLSPEDAESLVDRLVLGMGSGTSRLATASHAPVLRVQAGQVDLGGPPVVHKVGGPAKLSVDLHNVVVTSRMGTLYRILGPGFHDLEAFERVWDVVDLRPQRRTVTVDFVTRDGIPASCQAGIVCRIAPPGYGAPGSVDDASSPPYGYAEEVIRALTTSRCVRKLEGSHRVVDWVTCMVSDVLEGTVRDTLEQHRLDEFLNPQYWLEDEDGPTRIGTSPKLATELESEIEAMVRSTAQERGVVVDRVELSMVRPAEDAISRQWLEFWQARLQKGIDRYTMEAQATHEQLAANARFEARVTFVNRMLEEIQSYRDGGLNVPPQLIIASFMEVLHSMGNMGPQARRKLFREAENLIRVVDALQRNDADHTAPPSRSLPGGPNTRAR
jgi:hypothetical protein